MLEYEGTHASCTQRTCHTCKQCGIKIKPTASDRCAHLAQLFRVLMQLFQDGQSLLLGAVLQNPLNDSAAIRVCGKHKDLKNKKVTSCNAAGCFPITIPLIKRKGIYLTCPLKASIMNWRAWGWTHSIHFCTTWFPFWSFTHFKTWPSSSRTMSLWSV